jgi:hypothetical protein
MAKILRYRDEKGHFARRHAQRYLTPEIYDTKKRATVAIGNSRRGIDRIEADMIYAVHAAPKFERQPEIVLRSFRSLHDTLQPAADALKGYKLADVEVWYNGERIVAKMKVPLAATGRTKRGRWTGREVGETPMDRIRFEVKRALEEQGFAVTPEGDRRAWGDKRTKAFARDRYDHATEAKLTGLREKRTTTRAGSKKRKELDLAIAAAEAGGTVVRPRVRTIKPKIVIRGYK